MLWFKNPREQLACTDRPEEFSNLDFRFSNGKAVAEESGGAKVSLRLVEKKGARRPPVKSSVDSGPLFHGLVQGEIYRRNEETKGLIGHECHMDFYREGREGIEGEVLFLAGSIGGKVDVDFRWLARVLIHARRNEGLQECTDRFLPGMPSSQSSNVGIFAGLQI